MIAMDAVALVVVATATALALGLLALLVVATRFLFICRPHEVLIFTGRGKVPVILRPAGAAGDEPGAGIARRWRMPIVERVDRLDMRVMLVDVSVQNGYSAGNIPLCIRAVANVKVHGDPGLLRNAVERFLGQPREAIRQVAQETLEGALREVLAQMTPEQVNEDRLTFADNLMSSAKDDLDKLGLQLDTLKIQNVSDDTGYLDSLGRPSIAAALRDASNAENQAMQEIAEAQAASMRKSEVARATAETAIVTKRNELARVRAELEGEAQAVEREAVVAARALRARVEQDLQKIRAELEQRRLTADVAIPAQIRRKAEAILAKGEAAPTVEHGKAVVQVLDATAAAWRQMGSTAREVFVIQHLDEIVGAVVDNLESLEVEEVCVVDPGDGSGLANYAAAYPQTVTAVLAAVRDTTGVDVAAVLNGRPSPVPHRPHQANAGPPQQPSLERSAS